MPLSLLGNLKFLAFFFGFWRVLLLILSGGHLFDIAASSSAASSLSASSLCASFSLSHPLQLQSRPDAELLPVSSREREKWLSSRFSQGEVGRIGWRGGFSPPVLAYKPPLYKPSHDEYFTMDKALENVCQFARANFIETVEAHLSLNLTAKLASSSSVKGSVNLPNSTGKIKRIAVFAPVESYGDCGADIVGEEVLLKKIEAGGKELDFDVLITIPEFVPRLIKYGKVLGPRGLMPSFKLNTVTDRVVEAVANYKMSTVQYKMDKCFVIHAAVGKVNMPVPQLKGNLEALIGSIKAQKPPKKHKGKFIKSCHICSTMGRAYKLLETEIR